MAAISIQTVGLIRTGPLIPQQSVYRVIDQRVRFLRAPRSGHRSHAGIKRELGEIKASEKNRLRSEEEKDGFITKSG
jgi:hypothetical protein